jgi:hypothetical protein
MVRDFPALFGSQTGLVDVLGLAVLAERSDAHSRSHVLECERIIVGYVLMLREGYEGRIESSGSWVVGESRISEWSQIINDSGERSHSIRVTQVTPTRFPRQSAPAPADSGGFTNRLRASRVRVAVFQPGEHESSEVSETASVAILFSE